MEVLILCIVFALVFIVTFLGHWIDKTYNVQVVKWLNCEVSSPFKQGNSSSQTSVQMQDSHSELRERIENLEKIVTDSSWELNEKLRKL